MIDSFNYLKPETLEEAAGQLQSGKKNSILYAGGSDVLGMIKNNTIFVDNLVDLKSIRGLDDIQFMHNGELHIGSLVKIETIANEKTIAKSYSVLAQAALEVATPQLRNTGTVGGNICQRPRCWYFRGDFDCIRKGGDNCFADGGENKYHCVVGGDLCFIVHPSDLAVALLALDAEVEIFADGDYRLVPLNDFYILPDRDDTKENILEAGQIVTKVIVPPPKSNARSAYTKFRERGVWDFAMVSAAAVIQKNGEYVESASISLGGVAPKPWQELNVSKLLIGKKMSEQNIRRAADAALPNAEPMSMNKYKIPLARNIIYKTLMKLLSA